MSDPTYTIRAKRMSRYPDEYEWSGCDRGERDNIVNKLRYQGYEITITPVWPFGVGFYEDWDDKSGV